MDVRSLLVPLLIGGGIVAILSIAIWLLQERENPHLIDPDYENDDE